MDLPEEYVAARAVLLDALQALTHHLPAIILVGAQAVYLHTGSSELAEPPMTTDGDLALDVSALHTEPEITALLQAAEFRAGANPGSWIGDGGVAVDVMVVPSQSGRAKRGARAAALAGHGAATARITPGLEPALIDHAPRTLEALNPADHRRIEVNVAGPAALLTAKAIKVEERLADSQRGIALRLKEKDALDMLRLLQAVDTAELVAGFHRHLGHDAARDVSLRALAFLRTEGAEPSSRLPQLAAGVAGGDPTVAPSFAALTQVLLRALDAS
ncbi:MAG: hypothetical protein E6R06_21435 [Mycobacterium sp.]|jgi:hypothetical protein|nr:MAG: hypothetical protein E6R06_21435 [Mycobacterium sp.]